MTRTAADDSRLTFGVELEYADIPTREAADYVQGLYGLTLEDWEDRHYRYRPAISYERWNIMGDPTIVNSDGTQCHVTFSPKPGSIARGIGSDHPWKGAELISPIIEEATIESDDGAFAEMQAIMVALRARGATADPRMNTALHVHVGVSHWPWQKVAAFVPFSFEIQDEFRWLTTGWPKKQFFTEEDVSELGALLELGDRDAWWARYRLGRAADGSPVVLAADEDAVRRIIDVSPYFDEQKRHDTIEFRCFRSGFSADFVRAVIRLVSDCVGHFERRYDAGEEVVEPSSLREDIAQLLHLEAACNPEVAEIVRRNEPLPMDPLEQLLAEEVEEERRRRHERATPGS